MSKTESQAAPERRSRPYVNPYLAGVLLGLVLFTSFFLSGNGLGASGGAVLSVGSWAFMFAIFAGGYALAWFVRRAWT